MKKVVRWLQEQLFWLKYKLGLARPGIDFWDVGQEDDEPCAPEAARSAAASGAQHKEREMY